MHIELRFELKTTSFQDLYIILNLNLYSFYLVQKTEIYTSPWSPSDLKQYSWTTITLSMCLGSRFMFLAWRFLRKASFSRTRFPLVPGRPIGFREKRASDSSSPHRITPGKPLFDEIQVYRLPSNHWGPRETDLRFEFPTLIYPSYHLCTSQ
jgi:hypothetical protein